MLTIMISRLKLVYIAFYYFGMNRVCREMKSRSDWGDIGRRDPRKHFCMSFISTWDESLRIIISYSPSILQVIN